MTTLDSTTALGAITSATADAVAADAANAQVVFRASAVTVGAVGSSITIGDHTVRVDEPPALGGENTAPNPVEYYLAALISCQVVTYRFWADRLGLVVDDLAIDAEGDLDVRGFFGLDEEVRPGFTAVRVNVRISGPATDEQYAELQRTVDKHCPVLDLSQAQTPVTTTLARG